jgi:PilZ domain-containing protein
VSSPDKSFPCSRSPPGNLAIFIFEMPAFVYSVNHQGRIRMDTMTRDVDVTIDLRQHPRLRISAPFTCSFARRGLTKWIRGDHEGLGVVFDVSLGGAKVMSENGIKPGEHMSVSLTLPNQVTPTTIEEAAVRWGKDQIYGLEFLNLSPIAEMRLRKFISISEKHAK